MAHCHQQSSAFRYRSGCATPGWAQTLPRHDQPPFACKPLDSCDKYKLGLSKALVVTRSTYGLFLTLIEHTLPRPVYLYSFVHSRLPISLPVFLNAETCLLRAHTATIRRLPVYGCLYACHLPDVVYSINGFGSCIILHVLLCVKIPINQCLKLCLSICVCVCAPSVVCLCACPFLSPKMLVGKLGTQAQKGR